MAFHIVNQSVTFEYDFKWGGCIKKRTTGALRFSNTRRGGILSIAGFVQSAMKMRVRDIRLVIAFRLG